MRLPTSNKFEQNITSLSKRLKYLAKIPNSYKTYNDPKVRSENLQYNLSLVISHIIVNLELLDLSHEVFNNIIEEYNSANGTSLTFNDFEKINWIRTIAGELIIPELVRRFVWKIGYAEKEGTIIEIPTVKNDLVRCIQLYYKKSFENAKLTISREKLNKIITSSVSNFLTIDFFVQRNILDYDSVEDNFYWVGGEYAKHLRIEILSTIWLLLKGEEATENDFLKFIKLIELTNIWVDDDFIDFLNNNSVKKICQFALSLLAKESDLLKSENEFSKIWLDAEMYQHLTIEDEIPNIQFNYDSPFDFIESVNVHKKRFPYAFDMQSTRNLYSVLLRLIVFNDQYPKPYQNVLNILKDASRPFLVWTLYRTIPKEFPKLIPYLLFDSKLIPIAFKLIDKIEIEVAFLSEQFYNDQREEEICELKSHLWLEVFELLLDEIVSNHSYDEEADKILSKILIDLSDKVFRINNTSRNNNISHNSFRKRYEKALKLLSNKRINSANTYPKPIIIPRLILHILPDIVSYLKERNSKEIPNYYEFLNLNCGYIDLCIEILRLSNLRIIETEITDEEELNLKKASTDVVSLLEKLLINFYSITEINVQIYNSSGTEKRKPKRGLNEFGFEIIDWGYLFLHFEKSGVLKLLNNTFISALDFKIDEDKYDEQNKDQFEKIKLYLKSLMLAFISINQKKDLYEIDGLPVKSTLVQLENLIRKLSLEHSIDEISKRRIDVFNERFNISGYDIYYQPLTSLLYKSINYFRNETQKEFVEAFFANSIDIGRLLTAINILNSKELSEIISQRIKEIKVEEFINSIFTTTELQNALVEAINSENHWELANPLIERIQAHFKKIQPNDENTSNFLFEINLLLAFKEKDFNHLINLSVPKRESSPSSANQKGEFIKKYFIALFKLYYDKNYDEAIRLLKSLLSEETKNIRYAFHLYQAETLKAIENRTDITLLVQANQDWENFVNNLNNEEKQELFDLAEPIATNNIYYYVSINDSSRFDQAISKLSKRYLFDEEILPTIYNFYIERDLQELAFDYIKNSETYLKGVKKGISPLVQNLIDNSVTVKLLSSCKISFERIRSLLPSDIPKITPNTINDRRHLNTFILNELIQVLRIIKEKIEAIKQITYENRFNDFMQAILRLRFPIWGWAITDQSRLGTSTGGSDAGNADLVVLSGGGTNIALIEAFILRDKEYTQTHILKCPKYIGTINKYYVVVYYVGNSADFENKWLKYNEDVLSITYPLTFLIDKSFGFSDITHEFEDVNNFKIAKTIHNTNLEMFHIMINLGI